MRILGVDPGTLSVGYGLVDARHGGHFVYVECGIVRASAKLPVHDRLQLVAQTLSEIISEFRPVVLALEKAFYGLNAASALKLGQARGAVMLIGTQHAMPVFEYAPAYVKRAVVGHGRATKEDVQRRVALLCGLDRAPATDAADALAIALCHAQRRGSTPP